MSWQNISLSTAKTQQFFDLIEEKNDNLFLTNKNKKIILKDEDDEFNFQFGNSMIDIKFEFLEYIQDNGFPFLENNHRIESPTFYDFLKYNSVKYHSLANSIQNKNKKIMRLISTKKKLNNTDIAKIIYINNIDEIDDINIDNLDNLDNLEILDNSDEDIDNINYGDKTFY